MAVVLVLVYYKLQGGEDSSFHFRLYLGVWGYFHLALYYPSNHFFSGGCGVGAGLT